MNTKQYELFNLQLQYVTPSEANKQAVWDVLKYNANNNGFGKVSFEDIKETRLAKNINILLEINKYGEVYDKTLREISTSWKKKLDSHALDDIKGAVQIGTIDEPYLLIVQPSRLPNLYFELKEQVSNQIKKINDGMLAWKILDTEESELQKEKELNNINELLQNKNGTGIYQNISSVGSLINLISKLHESLCFFWDNKLSEKEGTLYDYNRVWGIGHGSSSFTQLITDIKMSSLQTNKPLPYQIQEMDIENNKSKRLILGQKYQSNFHNQLNSMKWGKKMNLELLWKSAN